MLEPDQHELAMVNLSIAMDHIQNAKSALDDLFELGMVGRALALTITKLDESEMWLDRFTRMESINGDSEELEPW